MLFKEVTVVEASHRVRVEALGFTCGGMNKRSEPGWPQSLLTKTHTESSPWCSVQEPLQWRA